MNVTRTATLLAAIVAFAAGPLFAEDVAFQSAWPQGLQRTWIGPDFWANRLQDWRLADGRVHCLEGATSYPNRTLHLLTHTLSPAPAPFEMAVTTGPVGTKGDAGTWRGFLIGAGGGEIDYRLTAMVHRSPAEDGGLLAVINGVGDAVFLDFTKRGGPAIKPALRNGPGFRETAPGRVRLVLRGADTETGYQLTLTATDPATGDLISEAVLAQAPESFLQGAVALVSHRGPKGAKGGYWFEDWRLGGPKVARHPGRAFGPVLATQYTLSGGTLKLTAQFPPLGEQDTETARFQVRRDGDWTTVDEAPVQPDSYTAAFRVEDWDGSSARAYRVAYALAGGPGASRIWHYNGTIQQEPINKGVFTLAAFTGHKCVTHGVEWNHNGIWFPHQDIVNAVAHHDPDFLFFSGDQIYEGDLTRPDRRSFEKSMLDYHYKWARWCWGVGQLARNIPCVSIPDDHDVYHGNIWGAGGRHAERQDDGGYRMSPRFVNAVQRTQTSHLPDPYDPTPVKQGIGVYYTGLAYGGIDFAIIEDRKWKSSPTVAVPEGDFDNGWPQNPDFDPVKEADVPGATLLGDRQLAFLEDWAGENGSAFKAVLSQTIFANVATLPPGATGDGALPKTPLLPPDEYPEEWHLATDGDSNGWPQTGRKKALRRMAKANAVHIAGDQHLSSAIQYGIDAWRDGPYALCVPSIANTWARRWYPPVPGKNRQAGAPLYTGDYEDGFGNKVTVLAVANPEKTGHAPEDLHNRAPGYGIVRFNKAEGTVTFESWPRWVDPSKPGASPYKGWPITFRPGK